MGNPLTLRFLAPLAPYGWPIVRFLGGALLATHGYAKVTGGMKGFAEGLGRMGVPAPDVAAWVSALAELVGGALLAIGLFTRHAGAVVAIQMTMAVLLAHRDHFGLIGRGSGSPVEYPLLLAAIGLAGAMIGGGRCSLDATLGRRTPA